MSYSWTTLDDGRPAVEPYPHPGSCTRYRVGCRCDACRAENAAEHRRWYRRKTSAYTWPTRRVPAPVARATAVWLVDQGVSRAAIGRVIGMDRRQVQRLVNGQSAWIQDRYMQALLRLRHDVEVAGPGEGVRMIPSGLTWWRAECLLARGWRWVDILGGTGAGRGRGTSPHRGPHVHLPTANRVEDSWKRLHESWGPNRKGAVQAWRRGMLISDCYDWDQPEPDFRPVPGSLSADLVREALTFARRSPAVEVTRERLHRVFGQWEDPGCATLAWQAWARTRGVPGGGSLRCGDPSHGRHEPPPMWAGPRPSGPVSCSGGPCDQGGGPVTPDA